MNPDLNRHLIDWLRENKPTLRELTIPEYVQRFLAQIDAAGFSVRKKNRGFVPNVNHKIEYITKVNAWKEALSIEPWLLAFPSHNVHGELEKAAHWLRVHAEEGHYKSNFGKFFHNWLSNAKPVKQGATIVALPSDERSTLIADGIRALAASRSEKLFPADFEMRTSVAARDLVEIPTKHLQECFALARQLDMRGTPGVYHVLDCWKKLKLKLRAEAEARANQEKSQADAEEEARWNAMTPAEREAETARIQKDLAEKAKALASAV